MSEVRKKMKLKKWKIHSQGRLKDSTLHNFPDSVHRNVHKYLLKLYVALPLQSSREVRKERIIIKGYPTIH